MPTWGVYPRPDSEPRNNIHATLEKRHFSIMSTILLKCPDCERTYGSRVALNRHVNSHSGKLRYVCHICNTVYHRKDLLNRHYKTVHSSTDGSGRDSHLKQRVRCARACDSCRRKRIKCSGGNPCEKCVQLDTQCTFSRQGKRPSVISCESEDSEDDITPKDDVSTDDSKGDRIRIELPDLSVMKNIWAESSDWSWVYDEAFQQLSFTPSKSREYSVRPDMVYEESRLLGDTNGDIIVEEIMYHSMMRLSTSNLQDPSEISPSMESPIWYKLSEKVENHFKLGHWRQKSSCKHIFYYFMSLYFDTFHTLYPFFWRNGFEFSSVSPILCISLGMAGAMFDSKLAMDYARTLHEKLCVRLAGVTLLVPEREDGHASLLVSMLVTQMVAIYSADPRRLYYAQQMSGVLVALARRLRLFSMSGSACWNLEKWVKLETRKRVAFAIFLNESYLSILTTSRPLMSAEELNLPLPCEDSLWTYVGDEWQSKISSLMTHDHLNFQITFSDLYHVVREDGIELPKLCSHGYRMLLLALQTDVWRFAQDSELFLRLFGVSYPLEFRFEGQAMYMRHKTPDRLSNKAFNMHSLCNDLKRVHSTLRKWKLLFSASLPAINISMERQVALSSKITYHSYYLSLTAPIKEIYSISDNYSELQPMFKQRDLVNAWIRSEQSRSALFHVKEILDTLEFELIPSHESTGKFNIASLIGLHHCAVVTWVCAGSFTADESDITIGSLTVCRANSPALLAYIAGLMSALNPKFGHMDIGHRRIDLLETKLFPLS